MEDKSNITRPRIRYSFLRVKKEAPVLAVRGGEQVEKKEQTEQETTEAVQATPDASSPALTTTAETQAQ
ncbi:hypothetical protein D3C72_2045760 [compost metagenome]